MIRQLLALHPVLLRFDELLRELGLDAARFEQCDAVERAVHELAAAGLLHRNGELIVPTRAALRLDRLLGD